MSLIFCALLLLSASEVQGSDAPCLNSGGHCQTDSLACSGAYHTGLCDGAVNRRCCVPSGSDAACTGVNGHCQDDSISCAGGYRTGLCAGGTNRRCCMPGTSTGGDVYCYGNINNLHPTGLHSGGVTASHNAVAAHLSTLNGMKPCYEQVAHANCIEASVIGGLASRESNGGDSLTAAGYGDAGHAWGILQCDLTHSGLPCKDCGARTCCHIEMLVHRLLVPYIKQVASKHPAWTKEQQLQGGVAAYNFGVGNVVTWAHLDVGSTGGDYSNDVIARAQYLKSHGWS